MCPTFTLKLSVLFVRAEVGAHVGRSPGQPQRKYHTFSIAVTARTVWAGKQSVKHGLFWSLDYLRLMS